MANLTLVFSSAFADKGTLTVAVSIYLAMARGISVTVKAAGVRAMGDSRFWPAL
jgi:hypothetical protein